MILLIGIFGVGGLLLLSLTLAQDGWLALVSGRLVAHSGVPHTDTLTRWTYGKHWVDQQWLGQLTIYGLARLGGLKFALLCNVAVATGTAAGAAWLARRRAASPRRVALVAAMTFPFIGIGTWHLRTQTLAAPLFLAVAWLLLSDRARPSRRVFVVLPLLAVWANVHGSVTLGALLVALSGLTFLLEGVRSRGEERRNKARHGGGLLASAVIAPFITPYGTSIVSYYGHTVLNSGFGQLVTEWQKTTLSLGTLPFFIVAAVTLWVLGKSRRQLTAFERLALLATMASALLAVRNLLWFSLLALVVLPAALDEAVPPGEGRRAPAYLSRTVTLGAVAGLAIAAAVAIARPMSHYERSYPDRLASTVIRVARSDPSIQIYSSETYADWLLWRYPELAGRIAYDARFELLSHRQLMRAEVFNLQVGDHWREAAGGARLLVLVRGVSPATGVPRTSDVLARDPGVRRLYAAHGAVALLRPPD